MSQGTAADMTTDLSWSRHRDAFKLFLRGVTVRAALPTAVVVGALLSLANQGTVIASGDVGLQTWLRMAFNFLVPFVVASIGFLSAHRKGDEELPER